jgi:hypothetical protein
LDINGFILSLVVWCDVVPYVYQRDIVKHAMKKRILFTIKKLINEFLLKIVGDLLFRAIQK